MLDRAASPPEVIEELRRIAPLDPDHLPGEIALLKAFLVRFPNVPQVACFDTAFHHDIPRVAQLLPVPRRYGSAGVRRYGFHGLSYSYLLGELARVGGPEAAPGRLVLAHLGSGASMAAVRAGKCVDTTRRPVFCQMGRYRHTLARSVTTGIRTVGVGP
jgi:acetate kinase